jgi:ATP-dependent Clp protease protease subunit
MSLIMAKPDEHGHIHHAPPLAGYMETYVKLAKHRVLFISEDVSDEMASQLSAMLLYFDNEDHESLIEIYINSHGGAVTGLFNIYDVMQMISAPIRTICAGRASSAAAVMLAAGTKGERCAFPNSRIMIHGIQCLFPIAGYDITNNKNYHDFLLEHNDSIMKVLSHHTGQTLDKIKQDCKEDIWLSPKQALEYGIIDQIIP